MGSFHFSNTTERTFKIASELVRHGAQPAKLSQAIFYNYPYAKVSLVGEVLSTLQRDESGRIAWIKMTADAMDRTHATPTASSQNRVNVARVAEQFGGGGHSNAAGFTLRQVDLPALTADVLAKLKEAVETAPPVNGNGREIKSR